MAVLTGEPVRISGKPKYENKKGGFSKDTGKKRPTLKELQEKKYPFFDSDLSGMLDDLLKNGLSNFQNQNGPKKLEGLRTQNIVGITGWLVTLLKNALCSKSVLCNLLGMGR